MPRRSRAKPPSPFRWYNSSPEVIRLVVMMYVRFPLRLRNVEDLLFERGIELSHETVRQWWNRFGPLPPHLARPVEAKTGVVDAPDMALQLVVPPGAGGPFARVSEACGMLMI